jgi:hypothetical protein
LPVSSGQWAVSFAKWKNGRMECWKNGRMECWKNGRMELNPVILQQQTTNNEQKVSSEKSAVGNRVYALPSAPDSYRGALCEINKQSMLNESLINRTLKTLAKLPQDKVREVSDFADFILKKYEEEVLQKGIEKLVSQSKTYDFLKDDENLYAVEDLKEKY